MQMTRIIYLLFALMTAVLIPVDAMSADTPQPTEPQEKPFYDVEILIFKNISVPRGHELNLPTPSPAKTETTLDLDNPANIDKNLELGFSNLDPQEFRLMGIEQSLKKSSRYQLLTHTAWRQPGLSSSESISVWITGGRTFGSAFSSIDQQDTFTPQTVQQPVITQADSSQPETSQPVISNGELFELEGKITITLSRYLHTQANLVLRKPVTYQNQSQLTDQQLAKAVESDGGRLINYSLNEKRRMRSKKLHYLDNPQFGLLVLITPYEKPPEENNIAADSPITAETPGELNNTISE